MARFTDPDAPFFRILGEVVAKVIIAGIVLFLLIWIYTLVA